MKLETRVRFNLWNQKPSFAFKATKQESQQTEDQIMEGFATLYDVSTDLGWFTMSLDRGAFKESIERGDDVVALFNHNWDLLLGRRPGTLELSWDHEEGLFTRTKLPDHHIGSMVRESLERGDLNQMSIGFDILELTETREEEKPPHLHVTKANLFDISVVTFAQIPETTVQVVSGKFASNADEDAMKSLLSAVTEEQDPSKGVDPDILRRKHVHKSKVSGVSV